MSRERPILFSGPMIRALLSGSKTQTRRLIKPQPEPNSIAGFRWTGKGCFGWSGPKIPQDLFAEHCPYGVPGDRLWVREAFHHSPAEYCNEASTSIPSVRAQTLYRADWAGDHQPKWTPSIHMPRRHSRITLEITDVRVQRLQDISEEDARAEGVEAQTIPDTWLCVRKDGGVHETFCEPSANERTKLDLVKFQPTVTIAPARVEFAQLWDVINGATINGSLCSASWVSNPFVWALTFRRLP